MANALTGCAEHHTAMNTSSSSSRILLLAGRRVPPTGNGVRVQRYRLARLTRVPGHETGQRLVESKRP